MIFLVDGYDGDTTADTGDDTDYNADKKKKPAKPPGSKLEKFVVRCFPL